MRLAQVAFVVADLDPALERYSRVLGATLWHCDTFDAAAAFGDRGSGPALITPPYPDHVSGARAYASASMHAFARSSAPTR